MRLEGRCEAGVQLEVSNVECPRVRTRFETLLLATMYRRGNKMTKREVMELLPCLVYNDRLLPPACCCEEVWDYLRYLARLGVVSIRGDVYILHPDKLSRPMRIAVESVARKLG